MQSKESTSENKTKCKGKSGPKKSIRDLKEGPKNRKEKSEGRWDGVKLI